MAAKSIILLLFAVANAIPFESSRDDEGIPPPIKNIYDRVNEDISMEYLKIVENLYWLTPFKLGEFIT